MAELNFNAQAFVSQQLPDALPEPHTDPFPAEWGLSADQKSMLNTISAYLGLLDTPEKVKRHWELLAEERTTRAAAETAEKAKEARYDPVKRASKLAHANVVNAANLAWREAVAERKRIMIEQDAIVEAARKEFQRLRDMA